MDKKKVFIIDDHQVVIEGIKGALKDEVDLEVVGESTDALEAISGVRSLMPDMVILDISMPRLNGVAAAAELKAMDPEMNIVIYTMYSNKEYVIDLFKAGISAYVLKEEPIENLLSAIRAVKDGGVYGSERMRDIFMKYIRELENGGRGETGIERLSARERDVFVLLAEGRSVRQIGEELHISPKTVETHKYNLMEKLKVTTLADLTKLAIRKNLIHT